MCIYVERVCVAVSKQATGPGDGQKRLYGKMYDMKLPRAILRVEEHSGTGPRATGEEESTQTECV